jgi:hypothetical protein
MERSFGAEYDVKSQSKACGWIPQIDFDTDFDFE